MRYSLSDCSVARAFTFATLSLFVGCSEGPSAPEPPHGELAPSAELALFRPAIGDLTGRIIPTLQDRSGADRLRTSLERFSERLSARDAAGAARSLTEAREALSAYGRGSSAATLDGPELSVIGLTLDRAALLLGLSL
ncbi:MAG: hypothetical protein KY464_09940 [Gemmatimonadetes bacterium]|nr:hypothetical protein [Gemmatimonadota bacterium]